MIHTFMQIASVLAESHCFHLADANRAHLSSSRRPLSFISSKDFYSIVPLRWWHCHGGVRMAIDGRLLLCSLVVSDA